HVSAQHGELIGGEWPREDVGAVEYLHSFEWAHGWSPVGGVRLVDLYVGILHDIRVLRDLPAYMGAELARRSADRLDGVARQHAAEIGLRERADDLGVQLRPDLARRSRRRGPRT